MHAHVKVLDLVYENPHFEVTLLHTQMCSRSNLNYGDFEKNIGMQCMQEFFWRGGGWFTWNIVNDVYILIKGKKSTNKEKNENVELTHCRLQSG